MTNKEIYECIDRKNDVLLQNLTGLFDGYVKSMTVLITEENHGIRKSIDALTLRVERQNSSVRELKEWKASVEGGESAMKTWEAKHNRKFLRTMQIFGVVAAFLAVFSGMFFGFRKVNESTKVLRNQIEMLEEPVVFRGMPADTTKLY